MALCAISVGSVPTLASPGLRLIDVEKERGEFFSDSFAQKLTERGVAVRTSSEIAALLGLERQKALLGCSDESSSCMGELAGALGVDGIITGSLAHVGDGWAINIKIISASDGKALAAASTRAADDNALLEWLDQTAAAMALDLGAAPPASRRKWALAPLIGGAALVAGGLGCFATGKSSEGRIRAGDSSITSLTALDAPIQQAATLEGVGVGLLVAGGVAAAAGGALYFLLGSRPALAVIPASGGAAVVFEGSLP